jgi:hypothetical protein
VLLLVLGLLASVLVAKSEQAPAAKPADPQQLDKLLAPIALYPDALIAQVLMCSTSPFQVRELDEWL